MNGKVDAIQSLPACWKSLLEAQLAPDESLVAWLEVDLDARLHFASGLVALTTRRLLSLEADGSLPAETPAKATASHSWPLDSIGDLRTSAGNAAGVLEALGSSGRLAHWRFTVGKAAAARKFVQRFTVYRREGTIESLAAQDAVAAVCPSCGEPLPPDEDQCPSCAPELTPPRAIALVRLVQFARPRLGAITLGFAFTLAGTAASLVPPYLTMPLIDDVLVPREKENIPIEPKIVAWYLGLLAGSAVLAWLLGWGRSYVLSWVSERIAADLRVRTYEHLQKLSLEFFGGKRTGDLMSRLGTDTDRICNFLALHLLDFGTDLLMMFMTAAILISLDPLLALVTISPFPVIAWLVHKVRKRLRRGFRHGGRVWGEMTSVLADTIPGIRVVKAFAQERREVERFRKANDLVLVVNDRVNKVWAFFGPMLTLLTEAGLLVVWIAAIYRISQGSITVGMLTAFLAYISRFYTKIESVSLMTGATQRAAASAHRLFEILDRVPTVAEPAKPFHPGRLRGEVQLRNVGFQYGNRPVLRNIDLSIEPGEMIGLVGHSGSGKSTLVNLVCRFYDVGEGAILADGHDIRSFPLSEYRRNIGIVLQEPFLFFGAIAENIAYGRPEATRDEIIAAAKAARAHEFILRLPDGYDSIVGERGQSLSGGERQRISIARALLIDPRILILDEATSSVDTETEREIQEALDNLIQGRTTIAIAHRLSTLRKANRLVVLERGRIVEVGRHDELMERGGGYARLHLAQAELAANIKE